MSFAQERNPNWWEWNINFHMDSPSSTRLVYTFRDRINGEQQEGCPVDFPKALELLAEGDGSDQPRMNLCWSLVPGVWVVGAYTPPEEQIRQGPHTVIALQKLDIEVPAWFSERMSDFLQKNEANPWP